MVDDDRGGDVMQHGPEATRAERKSPTHSVPWPPSALGGTQD